MIITYDRHDAIRRRCQQPFARGAYTVALEKRPRLTKRPLPGNITKTFTADGQIKWSVQPNSAEKSKDRKPGAPPHPSVGGNYSINEADRTLLYRLGRSPLLPSSQGEAPIAISLSENRLEERVPLSGQLSIGPTPRFLRTRWERTPS